MKKKKTPYTYTQNTHTYIQKENSLFYKSNDTTNVIVFFFLIEEINLKSHKNCLLQCTHIYIHTRVHKQISILALHLPRQSQSHIHENTICLEKKTTKEYNNNNNYVLNTLISVLVFIYLASV